METIRKSLAATVNLAITMFPDKWRYLAHILESLAADVRARCADEKSDA